LAEEDTFATHLVTAMNVGSMDISGDGLDTRPDDLLFMASEED
jgi:hypothetical protein